MPVILYSVFVAWNLAGNLWALNKPEALADIAKTVLAWLVFLTVYALHFVYRESLVKDLCKAAIGISILLFAVFAWQLFQAGDLAKESMYLITGLNGHKNLFSSFLFLIICFLIYARNTVTGNWKKFLFLSVILDVLVILTLRTKAVYIGSGCAFIFFIIVFFLTKRKYSARSFIIAGIIFLIILNFFFVKFLPVAIDRSLAMAGNNKGATLLSLIDEERLQLWKKSYHLIDNSPVVGTGPGNWQVFFPDATLTGIWRAEDLNFTFQRPHNDLLWILSETGYIGLNLWLLFLLGLILFALFRTQQAADQQQKNQVLILTSALVGFTVMSFFDFPKERIEHLTWFGILAALTCGSYYSKTEKSAGLVFPRASVIVLSVSAIFALAIGVLRYTGEYYTRKLYDYKSGGVYMQVIKSGNQGKSLAYSLDPTSVPLSWYTGNAFASLGQYDKAFADLLIAYKEHPYNRNVLNDLGSALVFKGDTSAAIEYYSEAARISPRYDEPRLNLAAIQIARKKYQEANRWLSSVMHDSERRTKYQRYLDMMLSQQAAAQ